MWARTCGSTFLNPQTLSQPHLNACIPKQGGGGDKPEGKAAVVQGEVEHSSNQAGVNVGGVHLGGKLKVGAPQVGMGK